MPKASPNQTSFSGGEYSPLVQGRVDVEAYKKGLDTCLNYIPTLQGPLVRRPGTKYVANVKDPSKPPALIPFQISPGQAYMLEMGDFYMRFYKNEGQVLAGTTVFKVNGLMSTLIDNVTAQLTAKQYDATQPAPFAQPLTTITTSSVVSGSAVIELPTPFSYTEAANVKYAQNGNTMYFAQSSHPVYKLQRFSDIHWKIQPVAFEEGPYLPFNSYISNADSARITLIPNGVSTGTLTTGPFYVITGAADNGAGRIRITTGTHTLQTGDRVAVRGIVGTVEANNGTAYVGNEYWTITRISTTTFDLNGSAFVNAYVSGGAVSPALFQLYSINPQVPPIWADATGAALRSFALVQGGRRCAGMLTAITSAGSATYIMNQSLAAASETLIWQLGTWNYINGFPATATFHQDRLFFAGAQAFPQQFDSSMTAEYERFATSNSSYTVADNNGLSFRLLSNEFSAIRWVKSSAQGLLAGTGAAEWQISPNNQAAALTPTNINAAATSFFGSNIVDAVQASNATLYVQGAGRKVREMNYFFQVGTFRSTDLTELSEHLTIPAVSKLAIQKEPLPLVWGVRTDGALLSMSYNRDDQTIKAGWARHGLGGLADSSGTGAQVQSIGVITASSATFDQLWAVTKRFINGTSVVTVETLSSPFNDAMSQSDAYCLDCGGTYDQPKAISAFTNAGSAFVTATSHGFNNGSTVLITDMVGLSLTGSSLVNGRTFVVASAAVNSFYLQDFDGGFIHTSSYSKYVSGGVARVLVPSISGLTWLKNETVGVVADGGQHPDAVVDNNGVLNLTYPAAKVQIGYRYNSDGATLRSDVGAADGSSIGKLRKINRAAFLLHQVGDFSFGPNFSQLLPCEFPIADSQAADQAPPLFSGITRDGIESGYDFDDQLVFRQSSGLPGVVQSMTIMMDETDV